MIYAYIGVVWGVNVGIYGIHEASGLWHIWMQVFIQPDLEMALDSW